MPAWLGPSLTSQQHRCRQILCITCGVVYGGKTKVALCSRCKTQQLRIKWSKSSMRSVIVYVLLRCFLFGLPTFCAQPRRTKYKPSAVCYFIFLHMAYTPAVLHCTFSPAVQYFRNRRVYRSHTGETVALLKRSGLRALHHRSIRDDSHAPAGSLANTK